MTRSYDPLPPIGNDIETITGPDGRPYMTVADTAALLRAFAGACRSAANYPGCDLNTAAEALLREADELQRRNADPPRVS